MCVCVRACVVGEIYKGATMSKIVVLNEGGGGNYSPRRNSAHFCGNGQKPLLPRDNKSLRMHLNY
jgi:hypothetical protein